MSKRNTVSVTVSAFALTMVCLFAAVITAQKGPQGTASAPAPVRGIDVIVRKNPGNSAARTVATDTDGHFEFPVLPAGSYSLILAPPKESQDTTAKTTHETQKSIIQNIKARETSPPPADIKTCSITILGAVGGTKTEDWNLETNRIIVKSSNGVATRTTPGEDRINVESDGKTPFTGTISKSRSNVKNN